MEVRGASLAGDGLFEPSEHPLHSGEPPVGTSPPRRDELAEQLHVFQPLVPLMLDLGPHVLQSGADQLIERIQLGDVPGDRLHLDAKRFVQDVADVLGQACFEVCGHLIDT